MKFLDLLAKLGILRYGGKAAVYRSARDRPAEFMQPGVFNAERDLTRASDIKDMLGLAKTAGDKSGADKR
jgi:hypothetical protein